MRKDIPSLGVLQAFEASARLQSFSRAAEELALTPSAVSRHVAALEDRLGVALFVRARQRLALTDTGRSYAARIRLHLEQIERDTQEIRVGRDEGYVLHLAVVSTFCTQWLIPRLPQFIVRGNRTPVFKNFQERDLHDAKGLSDIEMKRNPGLNLPLIGFLNRPIALQMYRDKERLNDIDELRNQLSDMQKRLESLAKKS